MKINTFVKRKWPRSVVPLQVLPPNKLRLSTDADQDRRTRPLERGDHRVGLRDWHIQPCLAPHTIELHVHQVIGADLFASTHGHPLAVCCVTSTVLFLFFNYSKSGSYQAPARQPIATISSYQTQRMNVPMSNEEELREKATSCEGQRKSVEGRAKTRLAQW